MTEPLGFHSGVHRNCKSEGKAGLWVEFEAAYAGFAKALALDPALEVLSLPSFQVKNWITNWKLVGIKLNAEVSFGSAQSRARPNKKGD